MFVAVNFYIIYFVYIKKIIHALSVCSVQATFKRVVIFKLDVFVHNQSKKIGGSWQCKNMITLKKTNKIKIRHALNC